MPQIGAVPLSLRGPEGWRGLTTLSKSHPFRFLEVENGYVNADGSELRTVPGYLCVDDPASTARAWGTNQPFGFIANHFAARRPVLAAAVNGYQIETTPSEQQIVWTRPTQLHCCEQLNTRWVFVGESDHVREPIFNSGSTGFVKVVSYDDNLTDTDLMLDADCLTTANLFNTVQVGDRIYLEGLTGLGAAALNLKGHNVLSFPAANVIRIDTNIGAMAAQTGQSGYVDRVTNPQASSGSAPATDDKESLTIWTVLEGGNVQFPAAVNKVFPAHVANRMRDFGDATGNIKQGNQALATPNGGRSRRRQKSIPYRLVPHLAGNRLVLVAPGYGCVFQVPGVVPPNFDEVTTALGINALGNDIYDMPRALGVPKGCMWFDNDNTGNATSFHYYLAATDPEAFGGSNAGVTARNGTYKFCVAYRDEVTGEIGRLSKEITLTTDNTLARAGIQLPIYFPGYLMHECLALTVNIYRTAKNGSVFFFDRTATLNAMLETGAPTGLVSSKYGLTPVSGVTEYFYHALVRPTYTDDATLQSRTATVPTELQQMPIGAKAGRTARGFTAFGGALGNAGSRREMQRGTLSLFYDGNAASPDGIGVQQNRVGSAFVNDFTTPINPSSFEGVEQDFGCSAKHIHPAYEGQTVVSKTLFPYPRKAVQLNLMQNTDVGYTGTLTQRSGRIPDVRYTMVESPLRPESDYTIAGSQLQDAFLILPRARVQFSEPDNPGVTPATNTTVLANEQDFDIEGIGDAGGQFVVATRDRTYTISFSQTPVGVPPDIVSDKFGCIAANSMVTFDGGCAWISARGPVVMAGGVTFIGQPLERFFVGEPGRYLRSNDGMLRHSWACHDAERNLLYFGVFAGRAGTSVTGTTPNPLTVNYRGTAYTWDAAAGVLESGQPVGDQIRSRFPCDEVLIYSYKADAWSVWRPPLTLGIQWMTRGIDGQGNHRVFFLSHDMRRYVLDDAYGNGSKESFRATVTDTGTLSTLTFNTTVSERTMVGLQVVVYKEDATTGEATLRGVSEVLSQTASTITLPTALTVTNGDIIVVGARAMRVETTFFNVKGDETTRLCKAGIRYDLHSRFSQDIAGSQKQHAFVSASVQTEAPRDGVPTKVESSLTSDDSGNEHQWLNQDLPEGSVHDLSFKRGIGTGASHSIRLDIVGGAQVRLHDLYVEVQ